jgi:hypothetical protein
MHGLLAPSGRSTTLAFPTTTAPPSIPPVGGPFSSNVASGQRGLCLSRTKWASEIDNARTPSPRTSASSVNYHQFEISHGPREVAVVDRPSFDGRHRRSGGEADASSVSATVSHGPVTAIGRRGVVGAG